MAWYIEPVLEHYQCVMCYFLQRRFTSACGTITFFPTVIPFPELKLRDHMRKAASNIVTILTQPPSTTVPSLAGGDPTWNALLDLTTQLQRMQSIPEPSLQDLFIIR